MLPINKGCALGNDFLCELLLNISLATFLPANTKLLLFPGGYGTTEQFPECQTGKLSLGGSREKEISLGHISFTRKNRWKRHPRNSEDLPEGI